MVSKCPSNFNSNAERWYYVLEKFGGENTPLVVGILRGDIFKVNSKIHRRNFPTNNVIPGIDLSKIQNILDNDG